MAGILRNVVYIGSELYNTDFFRCCMVVVDSTVFGPFGSIYNMCRLLIDLSSSSSAKSSLGESVIFKYWLKSLQVVSPIYITGISVVR